MKKLDDFDKGYLSGVIATLIGYAVASALISLFITGCGRDEVSSQSESHDTPSAQAPTVHDDGGAEEPQTTLKVCHKPLKVNKTIEISDDEVAEHIRHGDYLGVCE